MTGGLGSGADEETEDAFLGGALRLRQPARGYRAGVDAVLLAAAVTTEDGPSPRVLDAGAGVGTAGLCVARRCPASQVVLLERDPELARLAVHNVSTNDLNGRVSVLCADILKPAAHHEALGLAPASFDHVIANPPYHEAGAGTPARGAQKARANAMQAGDLERWVRFAARLTTAGGTLTLIHKAQALGEVLASVEGRFGAVRVLPVAARPAAPAIRILLQGRKGSRAPLTLLAPFVLHGREGHGFTPAAEAILKHGQGLQLAG